MKSFNQWKRENPDQCVGPGINYAWNRYMDSLAPPPRKTVNCVTPPRDESADTSLNGRQDRPPMEGKQMFQRNTFESNLTKFIAAALLVAFIASVLA